MASLYKKRDIWYISSMIDNKRLSVSLRTKDKRVAKQLKPKAELELLSQLSGTTKPSKNLPFDELVRCYLKADHNWSIRTKELNEYVFGSYQSGKPLPLNPTSRSIFVRTINACWNWGLKQGLINQPIKIEGGSKWESRSRVLSDSELKTLLDEIRDNRFNLFVRFAYYTGARSGEIRSISRENIFSNHIVAYGKSGKRLIKLNNQAQEILSELDELWDYTKDFVSHKFKKEARRLGIGDIRFHDLRRTFGYNLIRQGRPIYEVSKLLGHSSVTTTERHYAPLLATEIDDFVL
ncbi:site-specific integrase [Candidatus Marinimicrobia bacterium]|nr:site-specific integrase [Candidatus Neomarinimicrobiota bacterium]